MACPTCDHTMEGLDCGYYWCPRCGTLKEQQGMERVQPPKLVERCREFERDVTKKLSGNWLDDVLIEWNRLGIAESINPPGRRP